MKNRLANQKGFGAVEVLIIFVIVGLLSGAGYYVYTKQHTAKSPTSTKTTASQTTNATDSIQTPTGWQVYTTKDGTFSVAFPATWTNVKFPGSDSSVGGTDDVTDLPGCKAKECSFSFKLDISNSDSSAYYSEKVEILWAQPIHLKAIPGDLQLVVARHNSGFGGGLYLALTSNTKLQVGQTGLVNDSQLTDKRFLNISAQYEENATATNQVQNGVNMQLNDFLARKEIKDSITAIKTLVDKSH